MGRAFALARNSSGERIEASIVQNYTRDILHFPNPALILIAWCPSVWATCLACHTSGKPIQAAEFFTLLLKDLIVLALFYPLFCTLNALFDRCLDNDLPRNRSQEAFCFLAFLGRGLGTVAAIYYIIDQEIILFWLPCGITSLLYSFVKQSVILGQFVLACSVSAVILPSWMSSGGKIEWREELIYVGIFVFFWVIYISIIHNIVDTTDSFLESAHYLSYSPDDILKVTVLCLLQNTALSMYSYQSAKSPHFWILGVGIWAVNNAWHISDLRNSKWSRKDMDGRAVVKRNICLGLWMCAAEICELWIGGRLVF